MAGHMDIEIVAVDHKEAVPLARERGLTSYDANYLWLAGVLNGRPLFG